MKYLCLIYDDETIWPSMPREQADAIMGEYYNFTNDIQKSGHYLGGNALQPTQTATTVRVRNGKLSSTDGPFAETKEQLGGYYVIDVDTPEEAAEWAAKIPSARFGTIEVRAIMQIPAEARA